MTPQQFLERFDRVHDALRYHLGDMRASFEDCVYEAERRREVGRGDAQFLRQCQRIRNFLAHGNDIPAGLITIGFDPECRRRLEAVAGRLEGDRSVESVMVPWSKVTAARPDQTIEPLMTLMIEREFSHLPVIEAHRVAAVFDERLLFRAIAERRLPAVGPTTSVAEVVEGARFDGIDPADVGVVFASRRCRLHDLRLRFDRHLDERDRISLVIVTETGKPTEHPLGILTVWDLTDLDI